MVEGLTGQIAENGVIATAFVALLYWVLNRFSRDIRQMSKALQANTLCLISLQRQFLTHDAQIRGINPTAGDDQDARSRLATDEYRKLQETMSRLLEQVRGI